MSEYYKSLISDDEVIKELIKESKRREGKLVAESYRLKPNLNFFQRTVNYLVSNNSRIDKCVTTFKADYLKNGKVDKYRIPVYKYSSIKKPLESYTRQLVLQAKIDLRKSRGTKQKKQKQDEICNKSKFSLVSDGNSEDNEDIVFMSSNDGTKKKGYSEQKCKKIETENVRTLTNKKRICISKEIKHNTKTRETNIFTVVTGS